MFAKPSYTPFVVPCYYKYFYLKVTDIVHSCDYAFCLFALPLVTGKKPNNQKTVYALSKIQPSRKLEPTVAAGKDSARGRAEFSLSWMTPSFGTAEEGPRQGWCWP